MKRMKRVLFYLFIAGATFSVGLTGHRLINQSSEFTTSSSESLIAFKAGEQDRSQRCQAVYYGFGNGIGVYDPRCFKLQIKLSLAAEAGDVEKIKELLNAGANVNGSAEYKPPSLVAAARTGQLAAAYLLLSSGADINGQDGFGCTSLIEAVNRGHTAMVRLLLWRKADVTLRGPHGVTALRIARERRWQLLGHKYQEIINLLENAGTTE